MTQYQRITGKVFGGNATATGSDPQIAQFGSAQANTFVGTTDPATIQQLPAWGQGWIGAVTPETQFPPLPEMTGAMKVLSHQICGILQQGVSTWDSGTIYYTGNFVSQNGRLYISQIDENQGNNPATDITNWQEFSSGGGLEIGDVAFTQMAIDESRGKRRKLNGQIIVQEQYQQLTNILKTSIAQNPDMVCTEQEWQAEVTMSTAGICYKFVVDDEGGTIRLPKYPNYFIGGGNAPAVGNGNALGFWDGTKTGYTGTKSSSNNMWTYQPQFVNIRDEVPKVGDTGTGTGALTNNTYFGLSPEADKSGIEAKLDDAELIKGTYFIQVATGSETEENIINTLELNNPFVLLEPKFFETEVYNVSWLLANGTYNGSSAVHPSAYQALLVENNAEVAIGSTVTLPIGTEYTKRGLSVKLSTDSDITDEDFVVNPSDETFRLALKINLASSKAVVGNGMTLGMTNGTENAGLLGGSGGILYDDQNIYGEDLGVAGGAQRGILNAMGITTDPTKSGIELSDSNLYLYFYVGETVQNANLVNVGRIEEKIANLIPNNSELITSYGIPDYSAGVEKSIDGFTAEMNGILNVDYSGFRTCTIFVNGIQVFNQRMTYADGAISALIPLSKGDVVTQTNNSNYTAYTFTFYPLKGVN